MIELSIGVISATPGKKSNDAVFVLAGGPGQAASALAGFANHLLLGAGRDLVFVDARGTGKSNGLHCDFGGSDEDLAGYFNDMLPADRVAACRKELEKGQISRSTPRAPSRRIWKKPANTSATRRSISTAAPTAHVWLWS